VTNVTNKFVKNPVCSTIEQTFLKKFFGEKKVHSIWENLFLDSCKIICYGLVKIIIKNFLKKNWEKMEKENLKEPLEIEGVGKYKGLYGFEFSRPDRRRTGKRSFDIKHLWQRNHEIINLLSRGLKQKDIAKLLGVTPQTVSNTANSELGMRKISALRAKRDAEAINFNHRVNELTSKALEVYNEIFSRDDVSISEKRKVADTVVLELSGLRAPTKIHNLSASYTLSKEELDDIKKRALQAAKESGMIVDITPVGENS